MNESQKQTIKNLLDKGGKHCSVEFTEVMKIIDYRARISSIRKDLKPLGQTVLSEPCKGRCGRKHDAPVNWYWISEPAKYYDTVGKETKFYGTQTNKVYPITAQDFLTRFPSPVEQVKEVKNALW